MSSVLLFECVLFVMSPVSSASCNGCSTSDRNFISWLGIKQECLSEVLEIFLYTSENLQVMSG